MIFIPYFSFYSLERGSKDTETGVYKACKSIEMSRLIYLYIRNYLDPREHIYFSNGNSPIGIEYLTEFLSESFEYIEENSYNFNPNIKIHIKQFSERKNTVEEGVNRRICDFLKYSYLNNLDYLGCDMDQLIAYDVVSDFKGFDFGARTIDHGQNRSCSSCIIFVSKKRLYERDSFIKLTDHIDNLQNINQNNSKFLHLSLCGEGGYYRNFCYGKIKSMSFPDKNVHDVGRDELIMFIEQNRVKNKFVDEFLLMLNKNKDIK